MGSRGEDENEEETPLEIEDYSCNTHFEEVVGEIERYLVEEFSKRQELQRFLLSPLHPHHSHDERDMAARGSSDGVGEIVFGRSFFIFPEGGYGKGTSNTDDEGIAVEIHVQNGLRENGKRQRQQKLHPIARLFALPLFFLARGTTTAPSYRTSESSFYLSLLTTAVGRVLHGPLSLRFDGDPSCLPSPFFYANGMAPCFVSVGDHYQLAFKGVAPPVMVSHAKCSTTEPWTLRQLIAQPVVKCRFHCSAYPHPPEWCQRVSDQLDMFQLQIGPQSRVQTDVFDGICVSLQRTFRLNVPRRFLENHYAEVEPSSCGDVKARSSTLLWHDILELENETMLLSAGPTSFPFGTGTAPLRGIDFCFQWNQLLDTEAHDGGRRNSNLNPFAPEGMVLQNKLTIQAVAIPKKECELNHTACKPLSEYVYMVMEHVSPGESLREVEGYSNILTCIADEIVFGHKISLARQKALIDRLTRHEGQREKVKTDIRHIYFPGSLLCRFAYACANQIHNLDDVLPLWLLVVEHLGDLLESKGERRQALEELIGIIGIPDVEDIDHGLPLLVQKLQLLSYCARRMLCESKSVAVKQPADGWDDDMDDLASHSRGEASAADGECSADGFLISGKCLITNGEPLVEPKALPTPPCTSDVMMMKAQELQNLGTESAGRHTRAWIQSEGLFNDMCLFLYFNRAQEGRVVRFPDFVQWHSPRDFIPLLCDSKEEKDDDDAYLSERMRRHSNAENGLVNIWWPLWERATPRSPEEIIAQSFVPHEQARLIIRWMEKELSAAELLIETVHANFTNSLHRILSHRCMEGNREIATYAQCKNENIAKSIKAVMQTDDSAPLDNEGIRTIYCSAIRQIGEIETCLCAALAIERMLGVSHGINDAAPPPTDEPCTSMGQLIATLASPIAEKEEEDDHKELALVEASLNWNLWQRGGIANRFNEDDQNPVTMRLRATCMAERPLNTTACFQQMFAEMDETGVFRVALALADEVL
ncbi:hypothetical protein BCY84_13506 [Trypanosoma cruzi cruzi]|uniref:Rab3 GTPase-activating protein catalytic subunit n=1 Tax=Trypanosoma cruzi TaxID=5693 RepID=A0A2V2VU32_TRYCR|nr:hypothetical protein BCY84_13506 [Trypanosoma cruzi cruzi]PWU98728.1 hypothetical protein C4B63_11g100 [Trypanosoma cruzi]